MINVKFPDGQIKQYNSGITPLDIAYEISEGLGRNVLSARVNGKVQDAMKPLTEDSDISLLTWNDADGKSTYWHSSAHLMAEALELLYPGIKFGIGPDIENGFYYDVDFGSFEFTKDDLKNVENKMIELAKERQTFKRTEVSKSEALEYFAKKGDEYKLELISDLNDGEITFYQTGEFVDLCRGPHLPDTRHISSVKLLNIAGAYWRGDENRKMMTRIYGITFPKKSELTEYLNMLEEAKKRDHRKLGAELELFMFSEKVGAGFPIWLPKGTALRKKLEEFLIKEQEAAGYVQVITPHLGKKDLYITSGHYEKYGKDSFQPIHTPREGEEFLLKPMNCPHHCEIFNYKPHSYKELPIRIAEFGTVYRYEQSGELHGLTRVRGFTQDDAHIFCTSDQLKDEFLAVLELTKKVLSKLGFSNYTAQVSLRDPDDKMKYIGSDENWEKAEKAIIDAVKEVGLNTVTALGEAAFYGPKLDFMVKDAIGRSWQLGTIQVDYNLPERFNLEYTGSDNQKYRPVMIHRAPFGSMERFVGVLIEHTEGRFPLWVTPEQFRILPVSDLYNEYADSVLKKLISNGLRGSIDVRTESIGRKIRDTELKKIPYMLIVGEKEMEAKTVAVRKQGEGDKGSMSIIDFTEFIIRQL